MALARRQFTVTDQAGNVVPFAQVEVRQELVGGQPLISLYSDRAGSVPIGNPFSAGSNGFAVFHAVGGIYRVRAYLGPPGAPTFEQIWDYVPVGTVDEVDYSTDATLGGGSPSDSLLPSQKAVKTYADALIAATTDAMVFKGVIDCSANPNYPAADRGWTYKVSVAGKIGGASGAVVEAGDLLLCLTDGTASGTQAGVGASWNIAQTNIDGAVTGPVSATAANIAIFNGVSGKVIQDSGRAVPASTIVGISDTQTLSNKTLDTSTVAVTQAPGDNSTKVSTTAFVAAAVAAATSGVASLGGQTGNITLSGGGLSSTVLTVPRYDAAQSLSASQQAQARGNINAAPITAMAMRNVVINPAVDVSQELGTAGATLSNNVSKYIADGWISRYKHSTAVVTSAQIAAGSFGAALPGFRFGLQLKATTALTSPSSGDNAYHQIPIEGYRTAHWGWGAAGAASIVVAFQYYSTVSGTAFVRLTNPTVDRLYYHEITVAAGWNFYAFTVPGDTSGTWETGINVGLYVWIFASGKETTPQASLDAWGATDKVQTTNSTNLLAANNNLTVVTGLYIDVVTQLPVAADLPNLMRSFDVEYGLCQRYFCSSFDYGTSPADNTMGGGLLGGVYSGTSVVGPRMFFPVPMRISPTITMYSSNAKASPSAGQWQFLTGAWTDGTSTSAGSITQHGFSPLFNAAGVTAQASYLISGAWKADARL